MVKPVVRLPSRGDVFLVALDPTRGSEIRKTRPCLIVSPDELNHHLRTTIVALLTTGGHRYPYRVPCRFQGKSGDIVLDQLRTVDHERLRKRLGTVTPQTLTAVLRVLAELFEI
ncbi:MAG: type II toxin-antitoxin system PemK/MazF family toxin [Gemmatimonadaceae bacterium]